MEKILLKYNNPKFRDFHDGTELYVALDDASGGYPYQANIDKAHDFKTIESARRYKGSDDFSIIKVIVTYKEIEVV